MEDLDKITSEANTQIEKMNTRNNKHIHKAKRDDLEDINGEVNS